jgi:hypothetical protein
MREFLNGWKRYARAVIQEAIAFDPDYRHGRIDGRWLERAEIVRYLRDEAERLDRDNDEVAARAVARVANLVAGGMHDRVVV